MKRNAKNLLGGFAAMALVGCASVVLPPSVSADGAARIPPALRAAANEKSTLTLPAIGVQIYECRASAGKHEWAFVAPEADLFDTNKRLVGKHYAGPTWELADCSKTMGALKNRADASAPGAIPWLLLSAKSTGLAGALEKVTSLQRVNTVGGIAPSAACGAGNVGEKARVPYTADYIYFVVG